MTIRLFLLILFSVFSPSIFAQTKVDSGDWSIWRGPTANGVAEPGQTPPIEFSDTKNVLWKTSVPGRGHSSPTIKGDQLFLTTADEDKQTQSVLCYHVDSGELLWNTTVLTGKFSRQIHKKNTYASQTVVCNGDLIFTTFFRSDGVYLVCLNLKGEVQWKENVGKFEETNGFGYGSSPVIAGDLIAALVDGEGRGFIAAYDQKTGEEKWRTERNGNVRSSYSTPVLGVINGEEQILVSGGQRVAGYEPKTGKELWSVDGGAKLISNTVVWKDGVVFSSGGYPEKVTWATDVAKKKVIWENGVKCYEQSLLIVDDYLYGVAEGGIMYCWELMTGKQLWRARMISGAECASPILAGGHIYHANEKGDVVVLKPNPEELEIVQKNVVGEEIFATPTFVRNRIYIRSASYDGDERSETLYCFGKE